MHSGRPQHTIDQSRIGLTPPNKYTSAIIGHPSMMAIRAIRLILASAVMLVSRNASKKLKANGVASVLN